MSDIYAVEEKLWEAADKLRANTPLRSSEYSVPVLGLIFLKFADQKFTEVETRIKASGRAVTPARVKAEGAIHLDGKARFGYLRGLSKDVGEALNNAMRLIERDNAESLSGSLPTSAYTIIDDTVLKPLLTGFDSLSLDIEGDVFGKVYEYFLSEFALKEGQRGGEFFTPTSIVKLIVEIIEPYRGRIFDPACGSGGMFVQSAQFVQRHKRNFSRETSIYGQEKTQETVRLCKMNLAVHGLQGNIRSANSYYENPFTTKRPDQEKADLDELSFDFVMANPPFNVDGVDKERLIEVNKRYPFLLPRVDNANYLWIQLFYSSLNEKGRAGFVMANSASDARSSEQEIRRQLIEQGVVDVMVALGPNFFYTVTLPCTLWFFDKGKRNSERRDEVLFIDARHIYQQIDRVKRELTPAQLEFLANIVRLYRSEPVEWKNSSKSFFGKIFPRNIYTDVSGLCKIATINEIAAQSWSLNPSRYVGLELSSILGEAPIIVPPPELPTVDSSERNTVFICYSRKDKKHFDRLHTHLSLLKRIHKIDVWDDTKISAGKIWREEISNAIARAKVAILLVSADFLDSEFIYSDELPLLLEAAQSKGAQILPVLLSPCSFRDSKLADFQFIENNALSNMNWHTKEATWVKVAERTKEMMVL